MIARQASRHECHSAQVKSDVVGVQVAADDDDDDDVNEMDCVMTYLIVLCIDSASALPLLFSTIYLMSRAAALIGSLVMNGSVVLVMRGYEQEQSRLGDLAGNAQDDESRADYTQLTSTSSSALLMRNMNSSTTTTTTTTSAPLLETFWTKEQLELLDSVPRTLHVALGLIVAFIAVFGVTANLIILYVFSRFKRLRTPANVFIINLTISDFCACLLHPMTVYSALIDSRWSFGQFGCNLYGTGVGFFGLNTIVTLAAIAYERYVVITAKPAAAKWRITRRQAQKACAFIWAYCAALAVPPWVPGWSSYLPEGVLISCSWDYTTRTLSNRLYYIYLLVFGFLLPVVVLTYCYATIIRFIIVHGREMNHLKMVNHNDKRKQTDVKTAQIILMLALLYFTAWTPYAVVSLIGQFGPEDILTPMATTVPAFLAKTAVLFDPIVYGFSHPQFRNSVRQMLQHSFETSTLRINGLQRDSTPRNYPHPSVRNGSYVTSRTPQGKTGTQNSSSNQATPKNEKRLRNSSRRRRPSLDGKHNLSLAEYYPSAYVFQEEGEFHLFRQGTRKPSNRLKTSINRSEKNKTSRNAVTTQLHLSEPDLLRCSSRVIDNAPELTWQDYRRKRREYIRSVFFRSAVELNGQSTKHGSNQAVSELRHPSENGQSAAVRKSSLLSVDPENSDKVESLLVQRLLESASRRPSRTSGVKRRQVVHDECCECAYGPLSQTVTLAQVPDHKGRKQWRACMISGRGSVSCSLNSP